MTSALTEINHVEHLVWHQWLGCAKLIVVAVLLKTLALRRHLLLHMKLVIILVCNMTVRGTRAALWDMNLQKSWLLTWQRAPIHFRGLFAVGST
jgi:hypothetical protein